MHKRNVNRKLDATLVRLLPSEQAVLSATASSSVCSGHESSDLTGHRRKSPVGCNLTVPSCTTVKKRGTYVNAIASSLSSDNVSSKGLF